MVCNSSMRVLVVDDNNDAAMTMALLLKHCGHEAQVADSGRAALEKAPSFHPDVMFVDLSMPQIDGLDVARQVRQMPEFAATPLIAVSGYVDAEQRTTASAAGFDDFLPKPYGMSMLLDALARIHAKAVKARELADKTRIVAEQSRDQARESHRRLDEYWRSRRPVVERQVPVTIEKSGISHIITLPERAAADELRRLLKEQRYRVGPVFEPEAGRFSFFVYTRRRQVPELVAKHAGFKLEAAKSR